MILCIETATAVCSVALVSGTKVVVEKSSSKNNSHSSQLHLMIETLLCDNGYSFEDLTAVAVSRGPGSYTGLRIGASAAKGYCYALNIPLIAPDSLQIMAAGFIIQNPGLPEETILCPMIDARRMEVYSALYDIKLNALSPVAAIIINPQAYSTATGNKNVFFFGDGAAKCVPVFEERKNWFFYEHYQLSAAHMAPLVADRLEHQLYENVAYFEPFYFKEFIAGKPRVKGLHG
ncbi:MAG TPA: tRNA (adenosine(37)-N6)-threonylcarbamoyltransferase complex dimerization subunit type 1 TsaB [Bacteroidales bacterium]|nr:tRNA (adenosine(37)-N6)-threonylcarbamoyltransferase complex dimerization subunit type 1 TsaB [Bacteroidales bacterium]